MARFNGKKEMSASLNEVPGTNLFGEQAILEEVDSPN